MLDKFLNFMDRFELATNAFDWWWLPSFFRHEGVWWGEGDRADEYGLFWLNVRFSFYANIRTYKEFLDSKRD